MFPPLTIELSDVVFQVEERTVLKSLNLSLPEQRIGIVGSNGSGKSTLLRMLNGLIVPTQGEVLVDGTSTQSNAKQIRNKIAFVFQNPDNQIILPTIEEDLAFGLKNFGYSKQVIASRVDATLESLGMTDRRHERCHILSGGQKQLLAIAGALIRQPECILFDEPTTLLDLRNARRIADVMYQLDQKIIAVTHDLDLLHGFDRVLVIEDGEVIADDTPKAALSFYKAAMS